MAEAQTLGRVESGEEAKTYSRLDVKVVHALGTRDVGKQVLYATIFLLAAWAILVAALGVMGR